VKPTWHRVNTTLVGRSHAPGTVSVFFDYNLCNWSFGLDFEPDHLWTAVYFKLGPVSFEVTYWRVVAGPYT
jgi:hypothetical protein